MPALPHSEPPSQQQATANSWLHQRLLTLMGKSGSVFCGVTAPFSGILMTQSFVCVLQESDSPVLCKFWRLYGGVKGDLLQEGLCHAQVCCTQSPCPCGRPLLTCTSSGDTQTLKGRSGSVSVRSPCVHKVLCEPSEHPWQGFLMPFRPSYHLASCIIAFTGIRASLALRR